MTSLLADALEARRIPSRPDRLEAQVEGFWEEADMVVKLSRIHVHYVLQIPRGQRQEAQRALEVHDRACPLSQSVRPAIPVTYDAEFVELP